MKTFLALGAGAVVLAAGTALIVKGSDYAGM